MGERVTTTTRWECDGCDDSAEFPHRFEEERDDGLVIECTAPIAPAPAAPRPTIRGVPVGWIEVRIRPRNDPQYRRQADLERPTRLYCDLCSSRAIAKLDQLRPAWEAEHPERVVHISDASRLDAERGTVGRTICGSGEQAIEICVGEDVAERNADLITCLRCRAALGWKTPGADFVVVLEIQDEEDAACRECAHAIGEHGRAGCRAHGCNCLARRVDRPRS